MTKSSKLYSDSPALKKDSDGKVGIEKPSQATATDIGTGGSPLPGTPGEMPVQAHQEHQEMVERHSSELKDLHKRHGKEHEKLMEKHGMKEDKEEKKTGEADKKEVKETK